MAEDVVVLDGGAPGPELVVVVKGGVDGSLDHVGGRGARVRVAKAEAGDAAVRVVQVGPDHAVAVLGAHRGDAALVALAPLDIQLAAALARHRVALGLVVQGPGNVAVARLAATATQIVELGLAPIALFTLNTMMTLTLTLGITLSRFRPIFVTGTRHTLPTLISIKSRLALFTVNAISIPLTVNTPSTVDRLIKNARISQTVTFTLFTLLGMA